MAVAHVVGGLSLDDGRRFRSHLLECTTCRARVGELRAIAHDLADVERDERRERARKRTETKAPEGEEPEAPTAPTTTLSGRTTLLVAVGLVVLMALSAWNFVLRGRLQQSEQVNDRFRESVAVLQQGQPWRTVERSASSVDGQVATHEGEMVVLIDGLASNYGLYLLDADGDTLVHQAVEPTDGLLYEYVVDQSTVEQAERVRLTRTDTVVAQPTGPTVFEAERPSGSPPSAATERVGDASP